MKFMVLAGRMDIIQRYRLCLGGLAGLIMECVYDVAAVIVIWSVAIDVCIHMLLDQLHRVVQVEKLTDTETLPMGQFHIPSPSGSLRMFERRCDRFVNFGLHASKLCRSAAIDVCMIL